MVETTVFPSVQGFDSLTDDDLLEIDGGFLCCCCCCCCCWALLGAAALGAAALVVGCGLTGLALNNPGGGTVSPGYPDDLITCFPPPTH